MTMEASIQRSCSVLAILMIFVSITIVSSEAQSSAGGHVIERSKNLLFLASIPPSTDSLTPMTSLSSQLFLTSPSGSSAAYLIRRQGSVISQGAGHDFCYIQILGSGNSIWDSTCASITRVNTCSLTFSDAGLEIFDGSRSSWRTNTNHGHLRYLVLTDPGEMQILDQSGRIVWAASQEQIVDQNCGIYPAPSPFASPSYNEEPSVGQGIEQNGEGSQYQLGYQEGQGQGQEWNYPQQALNGRPGFSGLDQPFSSLNQPFGGNSHGSLVDDGNGPFDSGVSEKRLMIGVMLVSSFLLMIYREFLS